MKLWSSRWAVSSPPLLPRLKVRDSSRDQEVPMALNLSNKLPILDGPPPTLPAFEEPLAEDVQPQERKGVLRTSSYVIYVDLPGEPNDMLLVHSYAGTYDKVSR